MSTTSLKLPDELKQRAVLAAQKQGISPHAFMVGAIEQALKAAEDRNRFVAEAETSLKATRQSGKGYDADEVHTYLRDRVDGKMAAKPKAGSWRS